MHDCLGCLKPLQWGMTRASDGEVHLAPPTNRTMSITFNNIHRNLSMWAERERSGKRSGADRKSSERERSGERTRRKTVERERSVERRVAERERSGERGSPK